ncbi:MAG: hypothetical protein Q4A84_08480 [Neisseria sp.]|uniref:hypothetical protein n=1 Tax=Neisseria sp. TaxID=192066 RepID=UPI0026DAED4E|nr:hypothetical protein [Neisseria sp.]MDO4641715.1 hypothetical protein [Neisseria sp.]
MKKILIPALFCCLLVGIAALGGMYLGSLVYTQWMGLKSAPSVLMLYTYWQHLHRLPPCMVFPL